MGSSILSARSFQEHQIIKLYLSWLSLHMLILLAASVTRDSFNSILDVPDVGQDFFDLAKKPGRVFYKLIDIHAPHFKAISLNPIVDWKPTRKSVPSFCLLPSCSRKGLIEVFLMEYWGFLLNNPILTYVADLWITWDVIYPKGEKVSDFILGSSKFSANEEYDWYADQSYLDHPISNLGVGKLAQVLSRSGKRRFFWHMILKPYHIGLCPFFGVYLMMVLMIKYVLYVL